MTTKNSLLLGLAFTFIIILTAAGLWMYVNAAVRQPAVPENLTSYTFVIPQGQSPNDILDRLRRGGINAADWPTRVYLKLNPELGRNIQAGEYTLVPGLNIVETLQSFSNGQAQTSLTFIEGWRREEYTTYLLQEKGEDFAREFYKLTADLEGKLFPDTYFIDDSTTPEKLVEKMTANYEHRLTQIRQSGLLDQQDLSEDEAIILASIVEREVAEPVDQVIVAGILIKRIQSGWPLETDATVQYALANERSLQDGLDMWPTIADLEFVWWPKSLTATDLLIDSPYNTRQNPGLPPRPISNPGLNAIAAVAEPIASPYWFYLTDKDGITRYAETLAEHNQNIATFGVAE